MQITAFKVILARRINIQGSKDYENTFARMESDCTLRFGFKVLNLKVHTTIQPVFLSRKIERDLNVKETKPPIVNQQCVVYSFQCDLCDAGYVGYTRGLLHNRVKGHKQQSSAIAKHYKNVHGTMPQDLLKRFEVLKKCRNKFDCLVYEMLFIRTLTH